MREGKHPQTYIRTLDLDDTSAASRTGTIHHVTFQRHVVVCTCVIDTRTTKLSSFALRHGEAVGHTGTTHFPLGPAFVPIRFRVVKSSSRNGVQTTSAQVRRYVFLCSGLMTRRYIHPRQCTAA